VGRREGECPRKKRKKKGRKDFESGIGQKGDTKKDIERKVRRPDEKTDTKDATTTRRYKRTT